MPTSRTRRVLALASALVAGAALLAGTAHAEPTSPALCDTDASCAALNIGTGYGVTEEKIAEYAPKVPTLGALGPVLVAEASTPAAEWECLRGLGYVGDPADGVEALYAAPSDVAECSPHPA